MKRRRKRTNKKRKKKRKKKKEKKRDRKRSSKRSSKRRRRHSGGGKDRTFVTELETLWYGLMLCIQPSPLYV